MSSRKLKTGLLLTLILAFCSLALADDDNHGTDHSKGHSNDAKANCKKPPKPTPPPSPKPGPDPVTVTTTNTNTNTNNNQQSQQQQQQQSQTQSANASSTASASNNGNGNGNGSNNTTVNNQAAKIPVSTAYAPPVFPTANCFKGMGAGVQTGPFGGSFGGGKIDENCRALETARNAPNRLTFCKIYVKLKDSKAAGVTLGDCMGQDPQPAPAVEEKKPEVNIYLPPQVAPAEAAKVTEPAPTPKPFLGQIGICTFSKVVSCKPEKGLTVITPTGVCKQQLQTAKEALDLYPGTVLVVRGNQNPSEGRGTAATRADNVKKQLVEYGVPADRVRAEVGTGTARTVELILSQS